MVLCCWRWSLLTPRVAIHVLYVSVNVCVCVWIGFVFSMDAGERFSSEDAIQIPSSYRHDAKTERVSKYQQATSKPLAPVATKMKQALTDVHNPIDTSPPTQHSSTQHPYLDLAFLGLPCQREPIQLLKYRPQPTHLRHYQLPPARLALTTRPLC